MRAIAITAALVALIVCTGVHAATRRPSPAKVLWQHTHAPASSLVGVHCRNLPGSDVACLLDVQVESGGRECWTVLMKPTARSWKAFGIVPLPVTDCPKLKLVHKAPRAPAV